MTIPIYKPYLPVHSLKYAHDAINSGWISSIGEYKKRVEYRLKELLGVKYVLLLNSGTAAVHLASRYIKHKYKNIKNVIVPNNVYVAAWNGFLFDGNFNLIPIDADINTWCIDINKIGDIDTDNTMILAVHNVNSVVNVPLLKRKYPNAIIVEDACEGFLGRYERKPVGTEALCSCISFFGNKSITSGEGGALLTNDKKIYEYVSKLHGQGQSNIRYIHDEMGYNYRMSNIQAAILYGQIEILQEITESKKKIFDMYRELLTGQEHIVIQSPTDGTVSPNWMMGIRLKETKKTYIDIEKYFNSNDVEIRPIFYPMSYHKYLKEIAKDNDESVAEILSKECIMLPSYPTLTDEEVKYVVNVVKNIS